MGPLPDPSHVSPRDRAGPGDLVPPPAARAGSAQAADHRPRAAGPRGAENFPQIREKVEESLTEFHLEDMEVCTAVQRGSTRAAGSRAGSATSRCPSGSSTATSRRASAGFGRPTTGRPPRASTPDPCFASPENRRSSPGAPRASGRAIARRFAAAGALSSSRTGVLSPDGSCLPGDDVSVEEDVAAMLAAARRKHGRSMCWSTTPASSRSALDSPT
jgi:hypothetical protein